MPSLRPITNSGWGVRPPYSRPTATTSSPSVAIPTACAPNSRSSRSQIAYAANSRSCSRNARRSGAVGGRAGDERAALADGDRGHQPTASAATARVAVGTRRRRRCGRRGRRGRRREHGRDRGLERRPQRAALGDDRGDQGRRRHGPGPGCGPSVPSGATRVPAAREDRPGPALLELGGGAVGERRVDGDGGDADDERDAGRRRREGQRVGAGGRDHVAVRGDPVGADQHGVDLARRDPARAPRRP